MVILPQRRDVKPELSSQGREDIPFELVEPVIVIAKEISRSEHERSYQIPDCDSQSGEQDPLQTLSGFVAAQYFDGKVPNLAIIRHNRRSSFDRRTGERRAVERVGEDRRKSPERREDLLERSLEFTGSVAIIALDGSIELQTLSLGRGDTHPFQKSGTTKIINADVRCGVIPRFSLNPGLHLLMGFQKPQIPS